MSVPAIVMHTPVLLDAIGVPNNVTTIEELTDMLSFLHKRGFVAYYKDHATLKNYVVTKPSRVIDAISSVITNK